MLVTYALEERSAWFILAFALACALGSAYGFLQGAWPFGVVEVDLVWRRFTALVPSVLLKLTPPDFSGGSCRVRRRASCQPSRSCARRAAPICGTNTAAARPGARDGIEIAPHAGGKSCEEGGAQGGGLELRGALHARIEHVGEELAEPVVRRHAAVHPDGLRAAGAVARHRLGEIERLVGNGLKRCTRQVRAGGIQGEPAEESARRRVPVRGAQAYERRHHIHAVILGHARRRRRRVGRAGDHLEAVPQPLDGRSGDENGALHRIGDATADPVSRRRQHAVCGSHGRVSRVQQEKAAGAVGGLRHAGLKARLPDERGLLITGDAGNRQRLTEEGGVGRAVDLAAVTHHAAGARAAPAAAAAVPRPSPARGCRTAACARHW